MKRITLWLAVSLLTFTLGVAAVVLYFTRPALNDFPPSTLKQGTLAEPVPPSCFPGLSRKIDKLDTPSYFPPGTTNPKPEHEKFVIEWYTKHLKAMGEQSLFSQPDPQVESYRFLWLRSFHHPVAVRVWRTGDGQFLNVKQTSGMGGYEPGKLIANKTRQLTIMEWDDFVALLDRGCYWQLPSENDDMGSDGAQWILEGRREGRYHVVDRWSPQSGDFRETCLYLLRLSKLGIDLSGKDVY